MSTVTDLFYNNCPPKEHDQLAAELIEIGKRAPNHCEVRDRAQGLPPTKWPGVSLGRYDLMKVRDVYREMLRFVDRESSVARETYEAMYWEVGFLTQSMIIGVSHFSCVVTPRTQSNIPCPICGEGILVTSRTDWYKHYKMKQRYRLGACASCKIEKLGAGTQEVRVQVTSHSDEPRPIELEAMALLAKNPYKVLPGGESGELATIKRKMHHWNGHPDRRQSKWPLTRYEMVKIVYWVNTRPN